MLIWDAALSDTNLAAAIACPNSWTETDNKVEKTRCAASANEMLKPDTCMDKYSNSYCARPMVPNKKQIKGQGNQL